VSARTARGPGLRDFGRRRQSCQTRTYRVTCQPSRAATRASQVGEPDDDCEAPHLRAVLNDEREYNAFKADTMPPHTSAERGLPAGALTPRANDTGDTTDNARLTERRLALVGEGVWRKLSDEEVAANLRRYERVAARNGTRRDTSRRTSTKFRGRRGEESLACCIREQIQPSMLSLSVYEQKDPEAPKQEI